MSKTQYLTTAGLARVGWKIILLVTGASLLLGLLTALIGGPLIPLGSGIGGGYGIPDLFFLIAALLGLPGLLRAIRGVVKREEGASRWALVFIGPLLISFGYILIAHAADPCYNGWWNLSRHLGDSVPLCELFGFELNIHTRFHYLWHVIFVPPLVWLYGNGLSRWLPFVFVNSPSAATATGRDMVQSNASTRSSTRA